jgi:DedD protein
MVRNADGIQGIQAPPQATAIQENNFYINGERAEDSYRIETDGGQGRVMINVPRPTTAAVPDAPAVPEKPELQAAAPPQRAAARPAAPRPAAGASAPARPAPARPVRSDYWVQTGAFSAKVRAEGARETLAGKGIASIIENRVVDGKTWYRVRVGPYTSENEANYWLSLVKTIDGFADSQVRLTPSR